MQLKLLNGTPLNDAPLGKDWVLPVSGCLNYFLPLDAAMSMLSSLVLESRGASRREEGRNRIQQRTREEREPEKGRGKRERERGMRIGSAAFMS